MNQQILFWIKHACFQISASANITTQVHRGKNWVIIYSTIHNDSFFLENNLYKLLSSHSTIPVADAFKILKVTDDEQQSLCLGLFHLLKQGLITCNHDKLNEIVSLTHPQTASESSFFPRVAGFLKNPLLAKFNLFSANEYAEKLTPYVPLIFSKFTITCGLILVITSLLLLTSNLDKTLEFYQNNFYSPFNLVLLAFMYLPMKAIHEFAHAIMTKYYGGHVGKFGVLFFGFLPAAFVDVGSSAYFTSRKHRIHVSLAGIVTEIFIAVFALILFIALLTIFEYNADSNGAYHTILLGLFDLAFIGIVSSILFNANPLMRYDGYYVCSELLQIPNLASRAQQRFKENTQLWLFGLTLTKPSNDLNSEVIWLNGYGCAAFFYRIMVTILVLMFLISQIWWLGLVIAALILIRGTFRFLGETLVTLYFRCQYHNKLKRFLWAIGTPSAFVLAILFLPFNIGFSSTALLHESQFTLRSPSDGTVISFLSENAREIESGDTLLELTNPDLLIEQKINALAIEEQTIRYSDLAFRAPALAEEFAANLQDLKTNQRDLDEKLKNLQVISSHAGLLVHDNKSIQGRYFEKGEPTVTAVYYSDVYLEALISQEDLQRLPKDFAFVSAIPFTDPHKRYTAKIVSVESKARDQISSPFYSVGLGGSIDTDWRDSSGLTSQTPTFLVSVQLPALPYGSVLSYRWQLIFLTEPQSIFNRLWLRYSRWLSQKIDGS